MGNRWKYAQILQFPRSYLCECGHSRKYHNNMKGFCWKCWRYGRLRDITADPPDDVLGFLVGKREECEKFRKWSTERVRAFWQVVNIALWVKTGMEQTMLDDYYPIDDLYGYHP